MAADWSSLPSELVLVVAEKLCAIEDLAAFSSVCRSFHSATPKEHWPRHTRRPPWLLLCSGESNGRRGFLNMYKDKKKFFMDMPELQGRRCWGSSHGWIITLGLDLQLHLFNPLTRRRILLPQPPYDDSQQVQEAMQWEGEAGKLIWIRNSYIDRAILIKSPSSCDDDFLVVTTNFMDLLTVIRPGFCQKVRLVTMPMPYPDGSNPSPACLFDVARFNGHIYMLCFRAGLYICRNFEGGAGGAPVAEQIMPYDLVNFSAGIYRMYLVESGGDLLMVVRHRDRFKTLFDVYKLQEDKEKKRWVKLDDLGGRTIFVGDCQTIALSASEAVSCQSNCIYFAADNYETGNFKENKGGRKMGIFDFKHKTSKRFYKGAGSLSTYSTPKWFIPALT